jgi:dihydrofolate reductase
MKVGIAIAINRDGLIGVDGILPWDCPEDRAFFRKVTMGHTVVMGRNTWDTLPTNLPGRGLIVLSRGLTDSGDRPAICECFLEAYDMAKLWRSKILWVVGGTNVYDAALESGLVDFALVTEVDFPTPPTGRKTYYDVAKIGDVFNPNHEDLRHEDRVVLSARATVYHHPNMALPKDVQGVL